LPWDGFVRGDDEIESFSASNEFDYLIIFRWEIKLGYRILSGNSDIILKSHLHFLKKPILCTDFHAYQNNDIIDEELDHDNESNALFFPQSLTILARIVNGFNSLIKIIRNFIVRSVHDMNCSYRYNKENKK
jgi:hypothetical protein